MTIQEAIKSGKPFKRNKHTGFIVCSTKRAVDGFDDPSLPLLWIDSDGGKYGELRLRLDDILANDWEVKDDSAVERLKQQNPNNLA